MVYNVRLFLVSILYNFLQQIFFLFFCLNIFTCGLRFSLHEKTLQKYDTMSRVKI